MSMAVHENEESNTTAASVNDQQPPVVRGRRPSSTPQVITYTVQCNICKRWRVVPQEKYEEIRERIFKLPFVCEHGKAWKPEMLCHQPDDIKEDDKSTIWAIDRPNIPRPPHGWKRILKFRRETCNRLADVHYVTPTGMKLRSMVGVRRHLDDNPHYRKGGVKTSQFSFEIPMEKHARDRSGGAHAHGIAEPGESSGVNPSPSGVKTWGAKKLRVSLKKAQE